ncbi:bifunctional DNA primase/polymerase [Bifidobacterium myosotis]|uniref:bifunctional DNA primase/polymerase n=1 Tax=Bifidobacterium myosotis TaxID=1630166 RepID=UPI001CC2B981|nr:bifunctional DNA primase/polymerase [Bifidobacterium myosotis]
MTDSTEDYKGRPGIHAPAREGHADGRFLADVAQQNVFLSNIAGIMGVCNTIRPMDQPPLDSNMGIAWLRSLVMRPGESLWTWEDPTGMVPMWAIRMISEAVCSDPDLRVLPDGGDGGGVLYRRVLPGHTVREAPTRWAPCGAVRAAYGGSKEKSDRLDMADSWMTDALLLAGQTIRRGMSFLCTDGEIRFEHDGRLKAWTRSTVGGGMTVTLLGAGDDECRKRGFEGAPFREIEPADCGSPMTYTVSTGVTVAEALALAREAGEDIMWRWTGFERDSWRNLTRSLAAPFLRSHPEVAYVYQGMGGASKSTLAKDLLDHLGDQGTTLSLDLLSQPTAMSAENAMGSLMTHLLALSDDYDPTHGRFEKALPPFKTLLTGLLPFSARRRGEDAVDGTPQATHILTTNYHLPLSSAESEQRRFAFATMVDDAERSNRRAYLEFREAHGFWPFMLYSAHMWHRLGDKPARDTAFVDVESLTDAEIQAVRTVIDDGIVFPTPGVRVNWKNVGLVRTSTRRGDDGDGRTPRTAYRPASGDDPLAGVWRQTMKAVMGIARDDAEIAPIPDGSADGLAGLDPDGWAARLAEAKPRLFPCHDRDDPDHPDAPRYRAKAPDTRAIIRRHPGHSSWQVAVRDGDVDMSRRFDPSKTCWGMCVAPGYAWLDLDCHDRDGMDGWTRLQTDVGTYGETFLPRTFAVRTPSGGVHLLYRLPEGLELKNKANARLQVDTRVGVAGYVVAGGSRLASGAYTPIDEPSDGGPIPVMPPRLARWLESNGYVRGAGGDDADADADGDGRDGDPGAPADGPRRPADGPAPAGGEYPWTAVPHMGPHDTHDKLVAAAMSIAGIAVAHRRSQRWIDDAFRTLRDAVPGRHRGRDPQDWRNAVRSACEKKGIHTNVLD